MGVGVRQDIINSILKDSYNIFFDADRRERLLAMHPLIYMMKQGTGAGDKETQFLGLGELKQHTSEGEDFDFKSPIEGFQYFVNYDTFSGALAMNPESVEDSLKLGDTMKKFAVTWAPAYNRAKEKYAAKVFNLGGLVAGDPIFDGSHPGNVDPSQNLIFDNKSFFNLSGNLRQSITGGTYFNSIAGLVLDETTFEQLWNLIKATNNRDELDERVSNRCDTIVVRDGADDNAAKRILETTGDNRSRPFTQENTTNIFAGVVKRVPWAYLEDDAFYLMKRNTLALQFHNRMIPEIRFWRNENNGGYRASFRVRFGVMITDWRKIVRGGGTS